MKHIPILLTALISLAGITGTRAEQVMVFAAASLTDSLKQIAADYRNISSDEIVFNFGSSGALTHQIEAGAPADIFFSADEAKVDGLQKKGLIVPESRLNRLGNSLVLVTLADGPTLHSPADLTNSAIQRVAIGEVKTVPVGTYTRTYLEQQGLWKMIEPKTVPCENVRAVLAAVESGNVDAGFVYRTDAAISRKLKVVYAITNSEAPRIIYPVALVKDAAHPAAAKKFIAYLASEPAGKVFARYEFNVLPPSSKR